jgi:fructosamine-3-kinase
VPDWSSLIEALGQSGITVSGRPGPTAVAGGDISAAWRLEADQGPLFLKTGPASSGDMFSAEAEGLAALATPGVVRVPEVIGCGVADDTAFLALEWLAFERPTRDAEYRLGKQLAMLHETVSDRFGWHRDNTIGLTPQRNEWTDDWIDFFRDRRLGYQLRLAAERGFTGDLQEQGARLMKRLPIYFEDYDPVPSLLHGDLWGGNWACCDGKPVIFDPAVYYGDRESDLAMTRLFGGFGAGFYAAYEKHSPLAEGHRDRNDLYQLYHVLNHVNLFGSAYLGRAQELLRRLLRERK